MKDRNDRGEYRVKATRGRASRTILLGRAARLGNAVWFPGDPREWHITMIEWWRAT
jgi:hypothetical protein